MMTTTSAAAGYLAAVLEDGLGVWAHGWTSECLGRVVLRGWKQQKTPQTRALEGVCGGAAHCLGPLPGLHSKTVKPSMVCNDHVVGCIA